MYYFREESSKVKIKKYSAGILYEYNLGVRSKLESKKAVLDDSLFMRTIYDDMSISKNGFTKDVISIDFDMGSKSYEETLAKIMSIKKEAIESEDIDRVEKMLSLIESVESNKDSYKKMSADDIRVEWYKNGITINYPREGENKPQTIHYVRLFRSVGQAKGGSCLFINEKLYKKANNVITMGGIVDDSNIINKSTLVKIEAYKPLFASSIIGTIKIKPEEILVLKDVNSKFVTKTINIHNNDEGVCYVKKCDKYELKNTLFDGQALIDESIFPEWGIGYILLRQGFTKCAAFKSNIQLFFKDYFKDNYDAAVVIDMWGKEHLAKDIKLITTDNAIKWVNFRVSFKKWATFISRCNNNWGIVKTSHPSKIQEGIQQMSYQMTNCMDIEAIDEISKHSIQYVYSLKSDINVFKEYLNKNVNFVNNFEMLSALIEHNEDVQYTKWFKQRRQNIISAYINKLKCGKILQDADYLTIVGNPYAMLLHSVGENVEDEGIFLPSRNVIECYTPRFKDGELLAAFRNPHNSLNNVCCLKNKYNPKFDRYFDISPYCIAMNGLHTDFQDRLNGCDMDSDTVYVTNEKNIVERARYCYENYPTIVNKIEVDSVVSNNNDNIEPIDVLAKIDISMQKAQNNIGESSNLAQIALTYTYNFDDEELKSYVCILSVLAQVAIDSAKRSFKVDVGEEIKRIKKEMNVKAIGYPAFWTAIRPGENFDDRINKKLKCPMNQLQKVSMPRAKYIYYNTNINDLIIDHEWDGGHLSKGVLGLVDEIRKIKARSRISESEEYNDASIFISDECNEIIAQIRNTYFSKNAKGVMSYLIKEAFSVRTYTDNPALETQRRNELLGVLYKVNPDVFLSCFKKGDKKE